MRILGFGFRSERQGGGTPRARHTLLLISLGLAAAPGCLPAYSYEAWPPRVHEATGVMAGDHAIIRLLYATDRGVTGRHAPDVFFGNDRTRSVRYGQCDVTIPPGHGRGRSEEPIFVPANVSRHLLLTDIKPSESQAAFIAALRARVARSAKKEIFVFVHGYAVTFKEAARRTAQLVHDIDLDAVPIVYSWPAQGSLLSYLVDTGNAEWSALYLSQFLDLLVRESGAARIHLMAHSMGTQVLTRAIKEFAAEHPSRGLEAADKRGGEMRRGDRAQENGQTQHPPGDDPPFDQIILAAADMDAEIFERDYLRHLLRCSRRLTLYVSGADWALGGSRTLHRYSRLGQIGAPNTDLDDLRKVDMIDATDCDRGLIGHVYYAECPTILSDLRRVLNGETAAARGLPQRFFYKIELAPAR